MATNSGGWLYEANGTPVDKATADNAQARVLEIKQTASDAVASAAQAQAVATQAQSTANSYAGQIAQANTTAGSALATAQVAVDTADNAADRVDALEVMGGVEPGSVNDAEMKLHAEQDGGLFNTALKAQIVDGTRIYVADTASEGAAWEANRAAVQATLDAAAADGGGIVRLPPGRFPAKGLILDSHVHLEGELAHPDGLNTDVIRTRVRSTTGNVSGTILTVADATGLEPGVIVSVRGAGGISPWQSTTLTAAITASQTTGITLASREGLANSGLLQVGADLILYTGISGTTLTGVTRGMYGRTPAAHVSGAVIGLSLRHLASIESMTGTTITLDSTSALGVTGAPVTSGVIGASCNVTIHGNRVAGGASSTHNAVYAPQARLCSFTIHAERAEAALYLDSAWDNTYDVTAIDCSVPEGSKGSSVWLFRQSHRNRGTARISGDIWAGVYLDNRTSLATDTDGACNDNGGTVIIDAKKHDPWITNTGLLIVGGNRNHFVLQGSGVRTGVLIESHTQAYTHDGTYPTSRGNRVDLAMTDIYQPWVLLDAGNIVTGYYESAARGTNTGGSLVAMASPGPGESPTLGRFLDGTQPAPGIAFESETNTGFYKIAPGQVQFVALGQLGVRFRTSGILWADGKNLEFGSAAGTKIGGSPAQKLAFYGGTPMVQPTGLNTTSGLDLAQLEAELNKVKTILRDLGLAAG